eukprot:1529037-Amphidinium_carterae.1
MHAAEPTCTRCYKNQAVIKWKWWQTASNPIREANKKVSKSKYDVQWTQLGCHDLIPSSWPFCKSST